MLCANRGKSIKEITKSDALIAEIVLLYLARECGDVEHVGRVGHVAGRAVALKYLYLVVVETVHVHAKFEKRREMERLIVRYAVGAPLADARKHQ